MKTHLRILLLAVVFLFLANNAIAKTHGLAGSSLPMLASVSEALASPAPPKTNCWIEMITVQPLCYGEKGSLTAIAHDATGGYSLTWSTGATGATISNLNPGTYSVTMRDGAGHVVSASGTINAAPSLINITCNSTNVSAYGGSNGTVGVSVSGGVAPYKYLWSTGHTTQSVSNLPAGVYYLTVTDRNGAGCAVEWECSIAQPSTCTGFRTQTQGGWGSTPNGGNNGTYLHTNFAAAFPNGVTIGCATGRILKLTTAQAVTDFLPSGSTARALTTSLVNPGGSYSNVFAGQVAALSVSVGFDNYYTNFGTSSSLLQNLVVQSGPLANLTVGQVLAEANKVLGGCTSAYSLADLHAAVSKINESFVDGKTSTGSFLKCSGCNLSVILTSCFPGCAGNVGTISTTVSGGTSPYTYRWSTGATTSYVSGLGAGTYYVTVTDKNGCTSINSKVLTSTSSNIVISCNSTNVTTYGGSNGVASVNVTGGTPPYTYLWSTGHTTQTVNNLPSGVYYVTVTDRNGAGCDEEWECCITQPTPSPCVGFRTQTQGGWGAKPSGGNPGTYLHANFAAAFPNGLVVGCNGGGGRTLRLTTAQAVTDFLPSGSTPRPLTNNLVDPGGSYSNVFAGQVVALSLSVGFDNYSPSFGTNTVLLQSLIVNSGPLAGLSVYQVLAEANKALGGCPTSYSLSDLHTTVTRINESFVDGKGTPGTFLRCPNCNVVVTLTANSPGCAGGLGSINATVTGGLAPYTYRWSTGATSANITNLQSGTYTVTVTDGAGCTASKSATVTAAPPQLTASATATPASCFGGSNGNVNLTVSGGTTPYTYRWSTNPIRTTQNLTGVAAGTYTVTVTDARGCTATANATVTQPGPLTLGSTPTHVKCNGGSTGAIDLSVTGGIAPYTYSWNTTPVRTTQDITGLAAGTYNVTVVDANGCSATLSQTITQAPALVISETHVNIPCVGGTGSIDVSVNGGTSPFTYSWSNAATTQDLSGLSAGTYTVTVTDANSCTATKSVTITGAPAIVLTHTSTNVSCFGGNNGTIDLSITGGTSPFTYAWSTNPVRTTQDLTGLTAGTYTVTVTDANGCTATRSATITQPNPLTLGGTVTPVTCFSGSTGAIDLIVTGGTAPFTYTWNTTPVRTSEDVTGLTAGTYSVTVVDANNCSSTTSFNVTQPPVITLTSVVTPTSCVGGNDGRIDLSVQGGTSPYTYLWSNGAVTQDVSGLTAGPYNVTVTDANGCTATRVDTVRSQPALVVTHTDVDVTCYGRNNGSVDLTVTGGTGVYTYLWNNGAVTQDITGLTPGTYTVIVTDASGCVGNDTAVITQPDTLTASATATPVSCFGGTNGTATVTVTGGTAPFTYRWSTNATTAIITGRAAGNYSVTVTDANGCTATATTTITQPGPLTLGGTPTPVLCFGGNTGSIDLTVTGGTAPFTYTWNTTPAQTTQDITGLTAGSYGVTVVDANGCSSTASFTVTQPPVITLTSTVVRVSCFGGSDGSIDLSVQGGTSPYTYLWSTGAATQDISGLVAGVYTVTVTDANGCTATRNDTVNSLPALVVTHTDVDVTCYGRNNGSVDLTVTGGTGVYTYLWNTGAVTQDITGLTPGTYTVIVTDASGCVGNDTAVITQPDTLTATATATPVSCFGGTNGTATVTVTGGTAPFTYRWSANANNATTVTITGRAAGIYNVTVTDANGCTATATTTITQPGPLTLGGTPTPVLCFGGNTGSIDLTVTGGTAPFTYTWNTTPAQSTQDLTALTAGNYSVTVVDANGCSSTASFNVTQPPAIVLTSIVTRVSCEGGNNGSIDLTVQGGTAPYTYLWSNQAITQDLTGLTAGIYTVTVTDNNGCTATRTDTVTSLPALVVTHTDVDVTCYGRNNGSVDLTVSGGTGLYTYLWNNGAVTQDISGLTPGTYTVIVNDAAGCVGHDTAVITQPDTLTAVATATQVSCFGGNNGSVTVIPVGGTAPYTYRWGANTNNATTASVTGRPAGVYSVTITDANGCTATATAIITQPGPLTLGGTPTPVLCFGGSTGSIDLSVTGGTPPFAYTWNTTPAQVVQDITGLTAGNYSVTVVDANGCSSTASFNVTQPPVLTTTETHVNVSCNGTATGSIDLAVVGGTGPYTYVWSTTPARTTQDISGLTAGTYSVTVTDNNGCTATRTVTITEPATLTATETHENVTCFGLTNGSIDVTVTGGTAPFTYVWAGSTVTTQDRTGLAAGTYGVTVTDANGCSATTSVTITQPVVLAASATASPALCNGAASGSVDLTVTGGTTAYTYLWSNGALTQDLAGVAAGTYTVTVTDANGCTATAQATVTQPLALTLTATTVNVSCNSLANGSINLTVSGGTAPFTYLWSNAAVTQDQSGLVAGTYTVTVTDANGCTATRTETITEPATLTASAVVTNVLCFGQTNGAIDVTVAGGTAPFTYAWAGSPLTTQDRTGLAAGTYTVTITDANGCTATQTSTVTQPPVLNATATSTPVSCFGGNNGTVTVTPGGGTAPYTYRWGANTNNATTITVTGRAAGLYSVTVTDANGCTFVTTTTVTQPGPLTLGGTPTPVRCFGGATGAIDLTVTGGTAPFTYTWNTTPAQSIQDLTGLTAGNYSVTVVDANGCSSTASFNVTQPPVLSTTETHINATCNGTATGSIDLTVVGGTGPYTYAWNTTPVRVTQDLNGLTAGTYSVTVTDNNGCTATNTITITQPATLALTETHTNVSCNGLSNGSIDLTVSGGTAPFTYAWAGGVATQDRTGLAAGTYGVTVTDANGCSATTSVTITQPVVLVASATASPALCNGASSGSVTLTVTGGTPAYTYSWSNGAVTQNLAGVGAGTYTVLVTDANGCGDTARVTVTEPVALTLTATTVNVTCNGLSNGSIDLTVSGGTAPFTYAWAGGVATQDRTGLVAGTYSVTVTDANGCTATRTETITQPATLAASAVVTNVLCFGQSNGAIDVTVTGGTAPFTYAWAGGIATQDRTGLAAGTYTVTITDANGCTATQTSTVTQPVALTATATSTPVSCFGGNNGSVTVTPAGGTAPYTYRWGANTNNATTITVTGRAAGLYSVTVTDANGCTFVTTTTVTQPGPLTLGANITPVTCFGGSTGAIDLIVTGGTPPQSYIWSNGAVTQDITGLAAGSYSVTVVDANQCSATATFNVTQPPVLSLSSTQVNVACNGAATGSIDLSVIGGTGPYTYAWSTTPVRTTQDISGLAAGTYAVTVTDNNGCTATTSVTITQLAAVAVTATPTSIVCSGTNSGSIDVSVTGGTAPYTYAWSPNAGGATTQDLANLGTGTYTVTVTDVNGCTGTQSATINQPALLTATSVASPALCNGAASGSVNATISGGTAPYTYLWSNTRVTEDVTGLAAGTYTLTVTDANGCSATTTATVTQPLALSLTATVVNVSCNGLSNGSIDLTVSGGTAPFTYLWSASVVTTQDRTGLAAGSYSVTVRDANGCTATRTEVITQPATLAASAVVTNVLCFGQANGAIDVTITGGTGTYTYIWTGGATTQDRTGLAAGTYTVTITDANGCTATQTSTVTQPVALTATATSTPVSCFGGNNGTTNVVPAGGTAPYTYRWGANAGNATTASTTGRSAGIYSVTVTDANGCTFVTTTTVTQPGPLTLGGNVTPVSCFNGSNGAIDLIVTGGTPPQSYTWSTGAVTQDISGLIAGSYSVTVVDANGCSATVTIAVTQPPVLSLTTTKVDVTTFGGSNGSIDLSVNGGTAPYTYVWNTQPVRTTQDITGLTAGTYCVTVTDNKGCTASTCVTIQEPACTGFTAAINSEEGGCAGGIIGSLYADPNGGTAPYTYRWSTNATTSFIDNLTAGTYGLTITDASGCSAATSFTLVDPQPVTAVATATPASCNGSANGTVDVTPNGGTAPYDYLWSNGSTASSINGLVAGTYTVTVTDFFGCSTTASATVTQPTTISGVTTVQNVTCFGGTNGNVVLTASGGTPPYTYFWSNQTTSKDLTGVSAGQYSVTITDALQCSRVINVTVGQPGPLTLGAVPTPVSCAGGSNGAVNLSVSGGTPGYTYQWNTGAVTQDLSGLTSGEYFVTVVDANGCSSTLATAVSQPLPVQLSASIVGSCDGGANGSIDLSVNGGTSPYTYIWSNGGVTEDLTDLFAGNYTVTVTDVKGCTATATYTVGTDGCLFPRFMLKVMLEGPYNNTTGKMMTTLNSNNLIPHQQPYNNPVTNYAGTESAGTFNANVVDWVLVSFRTGLAANTTVYEMAGLLTSNGTILNASGDSVLVVHAQNVGAMYVVIEHRNHMGIMSNRILPASPLTVTQIDFTHVQSYQLGAPLTSGQKIIGQDANGPVYGMHSGDGDGNFDINSNDLTQLLNNFNRFNVYSSGDYNMDGDCNSNDISKWSTNFNLFSGVQH